MTRQMLALALAVLLATPLVRAASAPSARVTTAPVRSHKITETITGFGVVRPDPQAQTSRDATYTAFVRRVSVALGEPVQKGDAIVTLRSAPSARANYRSAKANLRFARQKVTRTRKLLKQHLATHADVDAAEQALAQAKAAFATQKALGTGDKTNVVKAPFTGIVSQLPVSPGLRVQPGTQLFQLARRDRLQVALGIEPDAIKSLKKGLPVTVVSLFGAGNAVTSRIGQINAVVDPNTRLVNVIAPLSGPQARPFLPGMRVKGRITQAAHKRLTVPRSAVRHDGRGDYVFIVYGGKAHRIDVSTGPAQDGRIVIRAGLKPGQSVVTRGNYELSDGMAVRQGQ